MPVGARAKRRALSIVLAGPANDSRQVYGDYLTAVGCRVALATDSDAALAQSLALRPDAVTVTTGLRPLSPPQFCSQLKTDVRTAAIPVIIVTTKVSGAAQAAGCTVQVAQPVSPEDLLRTVRAAIAQAKVLHRSGSSPAAKTRRPPTGIARSKKAPSFDAQAFLDAPEHSGRIVDYEAGGVIYRQGDPCDAVRYITHGVVKLSVVSRAGREVIVGLLGPRDFFSEGCLAGQPVQLGSATAVAASTILHVERDEMVRLLHEHNGLSDRFIAHMLERNRRVEADLVDLLFNSSEKRLARTLFLLARYGEEGDTIRSIPHVSQTTLAEMVGTTRSRVNFFMRKFERLGFIEYKNGLKINKGLLAVVLAD